MIRKLTSTVLMLYVVVLLMQPCEDVFAAAARDANGQCVAGQTQTGDCETESCSPFCICSCCSLSVAHHTFTTSLSIERTGATSTDIAVRYRSPYDLDIRNSIWQPPKA